MGLLIGEIRLAATRYQTSLAVGMRRLISSLFVLASVVLTHGVHAGQVMSPGAAKSSLPTGSRTVMSPPSASVMRPAQTRSTLFDRSRQPSLLRSNGSGLAPSRRPVAQMPRVNATARLPVASSRLMGSSRTTVHPPPSALFRTPSAAGKLQRRR